MPEQIGLAILGAGIFAKEAHIPALQSLAKDSNAPKYELLATYSRSHKSSSSLSSFATEELKLSKPPDVYSDDSGKESGLEGLLARKDIHAVIILLPITTQPAIILQCLAAGKHVLSEKPIAPSVAEGLKLISSAAKHTSSNSSSTSLVWRVAENFEAEPSTQKAASLIREGKIGKVTSFKLEAHNDLQKSSKYYQTPWRTVPGYQGGFLLDGGVHSAALIRTVIPVPMEESPGSVKVTGWTGLVRDYLEPSDTMYLSMNFGSGTDEKGHHISKDAVGTFNLSFASPSSALGKKRNGFDIVGDEGWLEILTKSKHKSSGEATEKECTRIIVHRTEVKGDERTDVITEEHEVEPDQGIIKEIDSFFKAINGEISEKDDQVLGDPKKALWDVAFIEAGLTSHGKAIDLGNLLTK